MTPFHVSAELENGFLHSIPAVEISAMVDAIAYSELSRYVWAQRGSLSAAASDRQ